MRAVAWSNGSPLSSGSGYGLRVSAEDRDRFFDRAWTNVIIELPGEGPSTVALSKSFWSRCSELRSAALGRWLLGAGLAPWPRGEPPTFLLLPREEGRFTVQRRR